MPTCRRFSAVPVVNFLAEISTSSRPQPSISIEPFTLESENVPPEARGTVRSNCSTAGPWALAGCAVLTESRSAAGSTHANTLPWENVAALMPASSLHPTAGKPAARFAAPRKALWAMERDRENGQNGHRPSIENGGPVAPLPHGIRRRRHEQGMAGERGYVFDGTIARDGHAEAHRAFQ